MDGSQRLTRLLRGGLVGDGHQGLGLLQQLLLLGEVLFLGGADLVTVGLTRVEELVGCLAELRPQRVVIAAADAAGPLPTVHQLVEPARGLAPCGRVLQLVRLGDDRLFLGLGMGALDVAGLRPLAAGLVERGACGGETLPQRVGLRLVDVHGRALMLLPLVEQGTELVCGGTPVDLVIQRGCEGLGLLDDLGAFFDSLGDRRLAGLGELGLLRGTGLLQLLELLLQRGHVADRRGLVGLLLKGLQRLVDLVRLHRVGMQAARQQIQLGLEVKVTTGVQRQRLLLGDVGELPDLTLGVALPDVHGTVVVDAAERFGRLHLGVRIAGCRSGGGGALDRFLGECGRRRGVGFRRGCRGRCRCGRRCLLGGFGGVVGYGGSLVGHGQLLISLKVVVGWGKIRMDFSATSPIIGNRG